MRELFDALMRAVEGSPLIAFGAAMVWGFLSIILSPCHMASLPLIVGLIGEQERSSTRRTAAIAALFATGILITIGIIGVITALIGHMFSIGRYGNYAVAAIFCAVGLYLMEVIPAASCGVVSARLKRKGKLAAFILGLVYGLALGPCTLAFMAPILGITFLAADKRTGYGLLLLLAYGIGHCTVIVLAGTFTGAVQRWMNWNEQSKGPALLKKICGALVLLGGVYLIYVAR
jgi:cytochrome c-type biogenesis protein